MLPLLHCSGVSQQTVALGHHPPRQPKSLAAALPLITDAKADDWRGGSGP